MSQSEHNVVGTLQIKPEHLQAIVRSIKACADLSVYLCPPKKGACMPSAEYDLGYLRAGMSALENYLLSNDLYWPVGASSPSGERPYPRLTLGGLLLAQKRTHARDLMPEQRDELARLDEQMDDVRDRWRVAWERKAGRGFQARLRLWNNFLEDYRESPSANQDRYRYEAERRVMLHLLMDEAETIAEADMELLEVLDKVVRSALVPGEFIWDPELENGFPRETYWYLYGQLKNGIHG